LTFAPENGDTENASNRGMYMCAFKPFGHVSIAGHTDASGSALLGKSVALDSLKAGGHQIFSYNFLE
jgi:hypothetical protein